MWIVKCFFLQELSSKSVAKHAGATGTHSEASFSEAREPHQKLAAYFTTIQMIGISVNTKAEGKGKNAKSGPEGRTKESTKAKDEG